MRRQRFLNTQVEAYNNLEELREDKLLLSRQIRKSFVAVQEGVKQSFLPADDSYLQSSSRYMRFIGYGLTAWKTARTVNKFIRFFKNR